MIHGALPYSWQVLISQSYLQSLNSRTLSLFTTAAQNLHQWSEFHAKFFGRDDVSTNPLTMPRADPEEVAGVRTQAPWKITNSIGLYRNMQLDPLHLGQVEPPRIVRAPFSMEYRKVIV